MKNNMLRTIGVTGNIGGGKSSVASVFASHGGELIDADELGKRVVKESQNFRNWLRGRFGEQIFQDGELDRAALGRIVFANPAAKKDLDRTIWPLIRRQLEIELEKIHARGKVAIVDAAMIFEWNDEKRYDIIIVVLADRETAIKRAAQRLHRKESEIADRYRMQIPCREKAARADIIISNDSSLQDLQEKAEKIWKDRIEPGL